MRICASKEAYAIVNKTEQHVQLCCKKLACAFVHQEISKCICASKEAYAIVQKKPDSTCN